MLKLLIYSTLMKIDSAKLAMTSESMFLFVINNEKRAMTSESMFLFVINNEKRDFLLLFL